MTNAVPAPAAASPRDAWRLAALALALTLLVAVAAAGPPWGAHVGRWQAVAALAFVVYGLAVAGLSRWRRLPHAGAIVVAGTIAMRLVLLPLAPPLSDDLYRYVWDGRVARAGIDPYAHAPADPVLAPWRDGVVQPRVNHPELRTIYPPLAEAGFLLAAFVLPGVTGMKVWILLHDLALVALLAAAGRRSGAGAAGALVWAWNPLVLFEYAGSGHHDPTGIVWLVAALLLLGTRPRASALAFSAAVLVKLVALPVLPFLWSRWTNAARVLSVATLLPGLALFAWRARGPASGLEAFAAHWRNNDSVYGLLVALLHEPAARFAAAAIVAAIVAALWIARWPAMRAARSTMRAALGTGPVLHPWYLGWALALEPGAAPSWPWLLLTATALLNYGPLATPGDPATYHPSAALRCVEYGAPLLLAIVLAVRARGSAPPEGRNVRSELA